jgi:hypothetical protein
MKPWLDVMLTALLVFTGGCTLRGAQAVGDKAGRMSKVAPELAALYDEYSAYLASSRAGVFKSKNPLVRVVDDHVVIDAVASGDVEVLKSDLLSLGMREASAFGRIVSGQLPISAIPAMAALPSLQFARAASASLSPGTPHR